jgi:hypothetical protein
VLFVCVCWGKGERWGEKNLGGQEQEQAKAAKAVQITDTINENVVCCLCCFVCKGGQCPSGKFLGGQCPSGKF